MKKSIFKSITLGIGGLLSLSFLLGIGLSNQVINKKDNNNALVGTSVNDQFVHRKNIKTEGTPLPTSGTLSSGTYYLSSDLTVSSQLKITSGDIIVNLNGFTLNGGGRDKGIFHVTGGTLTVNGKDDATGKRGTLNDGGGYYPGNYSYGGALYIAGGGATFNDLDITNCQSNYGGAIYMTNSAVTLNNCNLSKNKDDIAWGGHGVITVGDSSAAGTGLTVNGGEIFSNESGIRLGSKAKATINGAYIHDNDKHGVRVETNEGEGGLTISGNTIIKDNNPSSGNLLLNNNNVAKVRIASELGNDACIGVTMNGTIGVFTASADTSLNDASKFFSDDSNYTVAKNSDGQLYLTTSVATVTSGETVTEYSDFSEAVSAWNSAASGATLTLLKDVTNSSTINVSTTKTFDLNGHGINANGGNFPIFTAANGSDLTLNDSGSTTHYYTLANVESNGAAFATICDEATYEAAAADARGTFTGGYLTGANPLVNTGNPYPGGGIYILQNGVVTMNGGTIIGNIASNCAGGVGSYGKFIMNDGNIIYNRSRRGAVLANAGEMTFNGGHISYNTGRGTENCGTTGAIMIYGNCTSFIISGGYFTNNFSRYGGFGSNIETISISGNPVFKDNIGCGTNGTDTTEINAWLCRRSNLNVYFDIVGELTEGAEIGVTLENTATGVITNSSNISYNDDSKFFSDANYTVAKNSNGQLYLTNAVATVTSGETVTEYSGFSEAVSAWKSASNGAILTLLKDATISSAIVIDDDSIKTFDLNGYGILMTGSDRVFNLGGSSNITISDSNPNRPHKIQLDNYRGIAVDDGCTSTDPINNGTGIVNITGGYITGGDARSQGGGEAGGILVQGTGFNRDIISFTMEGGTVIGNIGTYAGGLSIYSHNTRISNSSVLYNKATQTYGSGGIHSNGGYITLIDSNVEYNLGYGVFDGFNGNKLSVSGKVIVRNNIDNSNATANVMVYSPEYSSHKGYVTVIGELSDESYIGIRDSGDRVFTDTNSQEIAYNKIGVFHSDDNNFIVGKNADGQLLTGTPRTVTYTTEHGTAPDSDTVANGSIIYNEPTSPSQEGYVFKGWYEDEEFENAWDFETNTVTSNTTLYAKWFDEATANVIKLINDIGDLTYDGGVNDSLDDIIAAKTAYDALTPSQKAVVEKENKYVLDHDILTYRHVDNVGDLIKEIPEASDSQDYYDAVDAALAAYIALTDEEEAILNAALDFQYKKTLDDNIATKEVIELIQDIGEVTYKGGQDDSKDDINAALDKYNNLTDEQKAIVDNANKDDLDDAKETYDDVDEAVNLINSIGDINHGGNNDSQEAINAAREVYDNLSDEEKVLVGSYNNSTQTLKDAEEVYDVLVKIDGIGDDDEKIKDARDAYDTLTPEQQSKVGNGYVQKLIDAENRSRDVKKQANILFIVFLILSIILIVSGLIVLYILIKRRKSDNNDNNKQVKLASVSGLFIFDVLASYFISTKFIIVYVLAAIAILIWLTNLILFILKKRQKEAKEEAKPEVVAPATIQTSVNEEDEEVETITDEKGNIFQIRFIKSFTAKLIQSPDETKKYYEELKNEVLSYKKTNSRISWHYDAVNSGRNYVLKFAVRGKTLCVYFPLNADDYADSKYKVEKVESKKFEDVPCLFRIKNDRRLGYAKELIATVASNLGLEKGEEKHEVYSNLQYEPNKPLVARGLIKEQKIQVNKQAEPVILESKVNSEGDEVVITKDASGNIFEIRYIKSFTAKLSQSEDIVKDYYTELKNYVLSYKDTHSRVSWHYDAINVGRDYILKFAIRGKTLCVYYALDASKLDDKYKVEEAKGKKFEDVPVLYRIKNERRFNYAKELIDLLMSDKGIARGKEQNEDYRIPTESTKALLAKGLIKEVKSKVQNKEVIKHYESISVSKADEEMSDERAESSLEEVEVTKCKEGKKEIINIDTLSEHYNNGDEVTLESLIEKGLVSSKAGHIKVLARGELNKKLTVVANDFSIQAIKMIVLVGGHAKKIK